MAKKVAIYAFEYKLEPANDKEWYLISTMTAVETEIVVRTEKKLVSSYTNGKQQIASAKAQFEKEVTEAIAALPVKPRKPAVRKNKTARATIVDGVLTYPDGSQVINGIRVTNDK